MKLSNVKEILKATVITGEDSLDMDINFGAASDLMSDLLRMPREGVIVLTGLTTIQVIRTSVIAGVSAVVFVRDKQAPQAIVEHANKHELPLLSTPFTMFTSCGRLFKEGIRGVDPKRSQQPVGLIPTAA